MEELEMEQLLFLATSAGQGERPSIELSMLKKNALITSACPSLLPRLPPWKSSKEEQQRRAKIAARQHALPAEKQSTTS
jgi:hypothetical protein